MADDRLRSVCGRFTLPSPFTGDNVALELRPNCEYCDRDLPPDSLDARTCSYECTLSVI